MISFPADSESGLVITTRNRDLRSDEQKSFDALREDAMQAANAAQLAEREKHSLQALAAKSQLSTTGLAGLVTQLREISALADMMTLLRGEFPSLQHAIDEAESEMTINPPRSASGLRDMLAESLSRHAPNDAAAMRQIERALARTQELLDMSVELLELLERERGE